MIELDCECTYYSHCCNKEGLECSKEGVAAEPCDNVSCCANNYGLLLSPVLVGCINESF